MKYFLFFIFLAKNLVAITQSDSSFVFPKLIIANTWGYHSFCNQTAIATFHLNDSVRIPFNEWSTSETRLNLETENISLGPGDYLVSFGSNIIDTIEIQTIRIDDNNQDELILFSFDSLTCCKKETGKFIVFQKNTLTYAPNQCDNLVNSLKRIREINGTFKIIGVQSDSTNIVLVEDRIKKFTQYLTSHGIPDTLYTTEIVKMKDLVTTNHNIVYPPGDKCFGDGIYTCEVGIIIE